MFEMQTMAIFMLIGFFVMLMIGVQVAITLATVGFVFGYLGFCPWTEQQKGGGAVVTGT